MVDESTTKDVAPLNSVAPVSSIYCSGNKGDYSIEMDDVLLKPPNCPHRLPKIKDLV